MKKAVLMLLIGIIMILAGCKSETSVIEDSISENDSASVQNEIPYNTVVQIYDGDVISLAENESFILTDNALVTEEMTVYFDENYGELSYGRMIRMESEAYYVILETILDSPGGRYTLLYRIFEGEILLCQELPHVYVLSDDENTECIKLRYKTADFGIVSLEGKFWIDEESQTLVPVDEWQKITDEPLWAVYREELPVYMDGKETNLPVGTELIFIRTNLQGTVEFVIKDTLKTGELQYKKDEQGRIYIDGQPASDFFRWGIVTEYCETSPYELLCAREEMEEDGENIVTCEYTVQGQIYTYKITEFESPEKSTAAWKIKVYEEDTFMQTIEQDITLGMTPSRNHKIWEDDVDFDGQRDLMLHQGISTQYARQGIFFDCFLTEEEGFVAEETFSRIRTPFVDFEEHTIYNEWGADDNRLEIEKYQYNGSFFKTTEHAYYQYDETTQDYILTEYIIPEDRVDNFYNTMSGCDMSEEDRKELERFLPVLRDETEMNIQTEIFGYVGNASLRDIPFLTEGIEPDMKEYRSLRSFMLVDMTGDGNKELVMRFDDYAGKTVVILEENGAFYAYVSGHRSMQRVYVNGIFSGTGGAGSGAYYRLAFEAGIFKQNLLASFYNQSYVVEETGETVVDGDYLILGEENTDSQSTYEEMIKWIEENIPEDVEEIKIPRSQEHT